MKLANGHLLEMREAELEEKKKISCLATKGVFSYMKWE
jgi:hypothetical protein